MTLFGLVIIIVALVAAYKIGYSSGEMDACRLELWERSEAMDNENA